VRVIRFFGCAPTPLRRRYALESRHVRWATSAEKKRRVWKNNGHCLPRPLYGNGVLRGCRVSLQVPSTSYRPRLGFPRDHGRHSSFQTEWWHLCGNLESEGGREWGYQFTVFRYCPGFRPGRDLFRVFPFDCYLAHVILTNCQERDFRFFEAYGTPLLGYARAAEDQLHLWTCHWSLSEQDGQIQLTAEKDGFGTELTLISRKGPVFQGQNGYCLKGPIPGQASVHYSMPSLGTAGILKWQGEPFPVKGKSWLDREWGTQLFSGKVEGWNWVCLHLDNDHEIMLFPMLMGDEKILDTSYGAIISPEGGSKSLTARDYQVDSTGSWRSEKTGPVYPMGWLVRIPSEDVRITVEPELKEHEQVISAITLVGIDYWEGPVRTTGTMKGKRVRGRGYVELTGYAQPLGGKF